jgi:hypothetical protein
MNAMPYGNVVSGIWLYPNVSTDSIIILLRKLKHVPPRGATESVSWRKTKELYYHSDHVPNRAARQRES